MLTQEQLAAYFHRQRGFRADRTQAAGSAASGTTLGHRRVVDPQFTARLPDTAERLALGGGWAGFKVLNASEPNSAGSTIRVSQVSRFMLLQPGQPVELTITRNEIELVIALTPTQRPTILPSPDLSADQAGSLAEMTRGSGTRWPGSLLTTGSTSTKP